MSSTKGVRQQTAFWSTSGQVFRRRNSGSPKEQQIGGGKFSMQLTSPTSRLLYPLSSASHPPLGLLRGFSLSWKASGQMYGTNVLLKLLGVSSSSVSTMKCLAQSFTLQLWKTSNSLLQQKLKKIQMEKRGWLHMMEHWALSSGFCFKVCSYGLWGTKLLCQDFFSLTFSLHFSYSTRFTWWNTELWIYGFMSLICFRVLFASV